MGTPAPSAIYHKKRNIKIFFFSSSLFIRLDHQSNYISINIFLKLLQKHFLFSNAQWKKKEMKIGHAPIFFSIRNLWIFNAVSFPSFGAFRSMKWFLACSRLLDFEKRSKQVLGVSKQTDKNHFTVLNSIHPMSHVHLDFLIHF